MAKPTERAAHASGEHGDEPAVLPWWYSKLNVAVVVIATAVLSAAIGWFVASDDEQPGAGSVDVGFLQDMREHHEQAVRMAMIYLAVAPDGDQYLREVAREIQFGQAIEIGQMVEMLRGFDAAESNETGTAMAWMDQPTPIERMPGMASDEEIGRLAGARGAEANRLFVELMVVHHEGGVAMAREAMTEAETDKVRELAASMVDGQQGEIGELRRLLAQSQPS